MPYKCNRAAVISDQYHESLPFTFREGYEHRRANLTLLFGDRWSGALSPCPPAAGPSGEATAESAAPAPSALARAAPQAAVASADDAWDVFG